MTLNRLLITSVVVENRSVREVAAQYGVSESWLFVLLARYRAKGEAAFEPRSRRPKTVPRTTPTEVVDLILKLRQKLTATGLDAGPDTIKWHLEHHHSTVVSRAMISRYALSVTAHHGSPAPSCSPPSGKPLPSTGSRPRHSPIFNGMVFTTRLSQGKKGAGTRNGFETELRRLGIVQKNSTPGHPPPAAKSRGSSRR